MKTLKKITRTLKSADLINNTPLYIYNSALLVKTCKLFLQHFPGKIAYAVKANNAKHVIEDVLKSGINYFDVASLKEITAVRSITSDARLMYMNPVKVPSSIKKAYFDYNVRDFSLDSEEEFDKILKMTNNAEDLHIHVRISVDNSDAKMKLGEKFGIGIREAMPLLKRIKMNVKHVGICFHVGSQCLSTNAYEKALCHIASLIKELPFSINSLDIGGGFPVAYLNTKEEVNLLHYFKVIQESLVKYDLLDIPEIFCEPGRALVVEAETLIVEVIGRTGNNLYLNDGIYGGLFEICDEFKMPAELISNNDTPKSDQLIEFQLWGPTCDNYDKIGSFYNFSEDVGEGDYIQFFQAGAYSRVFRSDFNGFLDSQTLHC